MPYLSLEIWLRRMSAAITSQLKFQLQWSILMRVRRKWWRRCIYQMWFQIALVRPRWGFNRDYSEVEHAWSHELGYSVPKISVRRFECNSGSWYMGDGLAIRIVVADGDYSRCWDGSHLYKELIGVLSQHSQWMIDLEVKLLSLSWIP